MSIWKRPEEFDFSTARLYERIAAITTSRQDPSREIVIFLEIEVDGPICQEEGDYFTTPLEKCRLWCWESELIESARG